MRPAGWPASAGDSSRLLPVLRSMNSRLPCSTFFSWLTTTLPMNSAVSALASNSASSLDTRRSVPMVTTVPFLATSRDRREPSPGCCGAAPVSCSTAALPS